jgi:hypothetical protein
MSCCWHAVGEWLKPFLSLVPVALGVWLAWIIRRAERLKDSYAEWAGALHHHVRRLHSQEPHYLFGERGPVNPQWIEWNKDLEGSTTALRAKVAVLLTREPDPALRKFIQKVSVVSKRPAEEWEKQLECADDLLQQMAASSWLILRTRKIKIPTWPGVVGE